MTNRAEETLALIRQELDARPWLETMPENSLTITVRYKPTGRPFKVGVQTYTERELT